MTSYFSPAQPQQAGQLMQQQPRPSLMSAMGQRPAPSAINPEMSMKLAHMARQNRTPGATPQPPIPTIAGAGDGVSDANGNPLMQAGPQGQQSGISNLLSSIQSGNGPKGQPTQPGAVNPSTVGITNPY